MHKKPLYLDGGFRKSQLSGEFAPPGPRDVVFFEKLFLQAAQLLSSEGGAVAADALLGGCGGRSGRGGSAGVGRRTVPRRRWRTAARICEQEKYAGTVRKIPKIW